MSERKKAESPSVHAAGDARRTIGNPFGLAEAAFGLAGGFVFSTILVGIYVSAHHVKIAANNLGADTLSLFGLWAGLVGAAVLASRIAARAEGATITFRRFREDFGLTLRPFPDLLIGAAVGIGAQFVLVPLFELPLLPFIPHLYQRLGGPAKELTGDVHGSGLVVLGLLVCLGSPIVEELFFRGLLLHALLGRMAPLGRILGPVVSVVFTGVLFGLVHFEALQLLGLIGFGIVLGVLATRFRRLGPGIAAHIAFNATTFIALAIGH